MWLAQTGSVRYSVEIPKNERGTLLRFGCAGIVTSACRGQDAAGQHAASEATIRSIPGPSSSWIDGGTGRHGEPRLPRVATGRNRRNPLGDQPSPRNARRSTNEDEGKQLASAEKNLRRVFAPPSRLLKAACDQPDVIAS